MTDLRVRLLPEFRGPDRGDGGIRRVVEAQTRWLPHFGIDLVDSIEAADVVATHALENPNVPVGQPWILHHHGLYMADFGWENAWYQEANRRMVALLRAADHVTTPSEWVAQVLRRGMWLSPTVIYHGVNPDDWPPGENEGYILWNKARQDAASDPAPVAELARRAPDLRFVTTFGEAAPNVRVTGALPYEEAQTVVRNAGVYLCTTRETLGIGTLEAMAAGVPVVGWRWGGQREIIRHGDTGWLATPGDYDGLLEGIRWALRKRAGIGEAARDDVLHRWTWEAAIGRYADLYRSVASGIQARDAGPKVSVIVPCYNLGRFLGDALASVQGQTLTDFECIVVDDASPDGGLTREVAERFTQTDPRFRYLRNTSNLHVSATRNRGMAEARGRYLVPLDADDMITPQTLELLVGALDRDRGLHLAYGGLQVMSETGVLREGLNEWPPPFDFKQQIVGKNQVPTLCMFRRELFERTGGYRSRISPVEDADLWTRAASIGLVPKKVTEAATLLYRLRSNSLSRTMPNPEWAHWYPWSRSKALLPFGAAVEPPAGQAAWPVPSYEPVKVSVIIPVGPGHEHLVVDALDSLEAQTFRQWECCVVNDTGAPLPWVPPWAKVITTQGSIGVAKARNRGIGETTASLLLFLDADDYLQPDALETLVGVQRETGGVVYSQWYDDQGSAGSKVYDPPEYDARLLTQRGCLHAVTALYPRSAVEQAGGFDEGLSHWEDWDLQIALAAQGVCGTKVPRPLWTYRKATGQRREANVAAFEDGKRAIIGKWGRVWDGKEELMACRSCPGGGGKRLPSPPTLPVSGDGSGDSAAMASEQGLVLLETLDASESTRMYKGKATGTQYRFGNNAAAKQRYVHAADATYFLSMTGKFRRVEVPPVGVAAGAPSPRLEAPGVPVGIGVVASREPVLSVAPLSDREAVAAVSRVAEGQSYAEVKARMVNWTKEQAAAALLTEQQGAARGPIIKILETAIYGSPVSGVPEGVGAS